MTVVIIIIATFLVAFAWVLKTRTERENQSLNEENQRIRKENAVLEKWRPIVDAEAKAEEILSQAGSKSVKIVAEARAEAGKIATAVRLDLEKKQQLLAELDWKIDESHKTYGYRKTLPASHESLKVKYDELKDRFEQLKTEFKESKSAVKSAAVDSKERAKLLQRFEKLARSYVEDMFKCAASRLTTSNFAATRDRVLKTISQCRALGYEWPESFEEEYIEKIREEFKRVLRVEEMKMEQHRIREQIREEQRQQRELESLKKKEEQAILEREEAERSRKAMQLAIEEALTRANGEHTAQILEMEKALAAKDQEIEAKQQEIDDNQRAISNAQLTKAGHVYVLSNVGSFGEGVFKIGMTRRNEPQDRVNELGDASVPFPFDVHLMVGCENAPELEKTLHRQFNDSRVNRVNLRKEFFKVDVDVVRNAIKTFLGKDVDYVADPHVLQEYAEQYRQSLSTSLADIQEVEELFDEAGVDESDE